jgi:hypothetical protein
MRVLTINIELLAHVLESHVHARIFFARALSLVLLLLQLLAHHVSQAKGL